MSKWKGKRLIIPIVVVVAVIGIALIFVMRSDADENLGTRYVDKYEGEDLSFSEGDMGREDSYTKYLARFGEEALEALPEEVVDVDVFDYLPSSQKVEEVTGVGGEAKVVRSDEEGYLEYEVDVREAGFYNMEIEYFPVESRGVGIERSVYINGEIPFFGADAITFPRVWTDAGEVTRDNRGNDVRPTQVESPVWQSSFFKDYMGYEVEPYKFYLNQGKNKIRLFAVNEPLVLRKFTIFNKAKDLPYAEYAASIDTSAYQNKDTNFIKEIQAETSIRRSSPSLYAIPDRSSPNTVPYDASKIRLNMVGGANWKVVGDWMEWDFEVPDDGMYVFGVKARQSYNRGFVSSRSISIDGEIPFKEASQMGFNYNTKWRRYMLEDENGQPYQIPLKQGTHTIRMEITLGDMIGNVVTRLNESVNRLNDIYRKILSVTGPEPDQYRDYGLEAMFPDVIENMSLESKRLYQIVDDLVGYSGEQSTEASTVLTLAVQMERFHASPGRITKSFKNFKENISALGTSIQSLCESSLDVDSVVVGAPNASIPKVKDSFIDTTLHSARTFLASFFEDYDSIGSISEDDDNTIEVWLQAGRDQSAALKTMIDEIFTPQTGINVNVKLVEGTATNATNTNALLNSVLAGTGPDVALTAPQTEPVNYALRNAAIDISGMEGIDEVLSEYYPSSYESYWFNGGLYALPETQNYNIMFYRTDILEEWGVEPPDTWQELIEILPIVLNNNLQVGIPSVERKIGNTVNPDLANYYAQLYQRGGRLYSDDGKTVEIDSEQAVEAFEFYTKFFTSYKLPKQYDIVNRFRSGEMPIAIADYSNFNTLAVFAPEIRGLWDFALIPGVEQPDGTINRATQSWGTCAMMLRTVDNQENAWTFMKWWASAEANVRFGRELETIMGAAARYATANHVAFDQLAWSNREATVLKEQWKYAFGLPEVAGGYYTARHITNAIRKVMNQNEDPRETLLDYVFTINDEIAKKRDEFGMD